MRKKTEQGQAMMEFASTVIYPLIIIVGGVIIGLWVHYSQQVENAADEAARAVQIWNVNSVMYPSCRAAAEGAVEKMTSVEFTITLDESVCPDTPQVIETGTLIPIEVTFLYEPTFFSTVLNPPTPRIIPITAKAIPMHE